MAVSTVTTDEVIRIHNKLAEDFAVTADPISPPGVRDRGLLESAVGRQLVSNGGELKYKTVNESAATLLFGICCDHPFYNGNKRTALVAMLVHLDKNRHTLFGVTEGELLQMVVDVAEHSFGLSPDRWKAERQRRNRGTDEEVGAIAIWIRKHMDWLERGERSITYRHLRQILSGSGYSLGTTKGHTIEIIKAETKPGTVFRRAKTVERRIDSIPYPGEHAVVPLHVIRKIRRVCRLREEDGVDSAAFYDDDMPIDHFINKYRTILRRLASR